MKTKMIMGALSAFMFAAPAMADLVVPWLAYRTGPVAPSGIPLADGTMPMAVVQALQMCTNCTRIGGAAAARGAKVVFENPVGRGEGSQSAVASQHTSRTVLYVACP